MSEKIPYHQSCGCKVCNCTLGDRMVDPQEWKTINSNTTTTIEDFSIVYDSKKRTLETLLDSIPAEEWQAVKLKMDSKKAHEASKRFQEKRDSALKFGDWILTKDLLASFNDIMEPRWIERFGNEITYYTTEEIYNIYLSGEWDEDDSEWDSTLEDGLEDL